MLHHRPSAPRSREYPRRRVLALVLGALGLSAVLGSGLVLSLLDVARPETGKIQAPPTAPATARPPAAAPVSAAVARQRDALAARPMPDTGTGHAYGDSPLSTRDPGEPIVLPPATTTDALGVATGYPHTWAGAIAQLAAIDSSALQSASLPGARAVITAWAVPGGPSATSWSGVRAMGGLLQSAGVSGAGAQSLRIRVTPAMALIKGTVGSDFTVVCIDLAVDIALDGTSRSAAADCQRMLWTGQRWVIGPGTEPAAATSVWPDTDAALDAGYRDLAAQPDQGSGRG